MIGEEKIDNVPIVEFRSQLLDGFVCDLGPVDVLDVVDWIQDIPFEDWPQQSRLPDGKLRPAMVTDQSWHEFSTKTEPIVSLIVSALHLQWQEFGTKALQAYQRMLSVVMPGHMIPIHRDAQDTHWAARIHVPLTTNPRAIYLTGTGKEDARAIHMEVGRFYRINTFALHGVRNDGDTPRVHFMFDVRN